MFARQIAVMKGQAWNVVETLKTPDHGPLELTRRAKVCVWDDLVDVPIAVPMRATSSEIRRRAESELTLNIQEEMDIAASGTSSSGPQQIVDLLSMATPPADLPHPGRFEMSSSITSLPEEPASAPEPGSPSSTSLHLPPAASNNKNGRPHLPRNSISHGAVRSLNMYSPERHREHQRRFSFATAATRRNSNSIAAQLYGGGGGGGEYARSSHDGGYRYHGQGGMTFEDDDGDELEGDLGYAAAEGMEGNRRKVIVERLEPVKSKNPVFTWC